MQGLYHIKNKNEIQNGVQNDFRTPFIIFAFFLDMYGFFVHTETRI